jgi:ABC-type sugar transport system substrate-binding protein
MAIRDMDKIGEITTVGYDTTPELLEVLDRSAVSATVTQNPYIQGYSAAKMMCRILLERYNPPKKMWYTSTDIILDSQHLALNLESAYNI